MDMKIEIPDGYEAKIEGNKVVLEPKESEDERILNALITHISIYEGDFTTVGVTRLEMLDWLKKLKKQKEQKPIFRVGDYVRNIKTGDKVLIEQLDIATKIYCYVSNDGAAEIHSDFPFSKQDEWEVIGQQVEQKPAEWSEEDERVIHDAHCWLDEYAGFLVSANKDKAKMLWKLSEKLKSLRPQPHWKPSEYQMKALYALVSDGGITYVSQLSYLKFLYEDLKKL